MRIFFSFLALLFFTLPAFAQNADAQSYDELMKRSRRARTTSIIMVSTGPVIAAGGIGTLIYGLVQKEMGDEDPIFDSNGNFIGYETKKHNTEIVVGAAAALVGLGVAISSIAFSNKADDLRREARKVKLKTSTDRIKIPGFQNSYATGTTQYKLSLVIPIGR
ncbi:MAG TPA: hypothetical protein VK489_06500 [Ferruginibacter sp.]|nr:hypothetical protein [Ferruginibacter sp.]